MACCVTFGYPTGRVGASAARSHAATRHAGRLRDPCTPWPPHRLTSPKRAGYRVRRGLRGRPIYPPAPHAHISAFVGQGGARALAPLPASTRPPPSGSKRRLALAPTVAAGGRCCSRLHPAYADKTNATAVLQCCASPLGAAFDLGGSPRSVGHCSRSSTGPGHARRERRHRIGTQRGRVDGRRRRAAFLVGDGRRRRGRARRHRRHRGFVERWRSPGEARTKVWDERFSEVRLRPARGIGARTGRVHRQRRDAPGRRRSKRRARSPASSTASRSSTTSWRPSAPRACASGLLLASLPEQSNAGDVVALASAADGADGVVPRHQSHRRAPSVRPISSQLEHGADRVRQVSRGKVRWRSSRPDAEPQRVGHRRATRNGSSVSSVRGAWPWRGARSAATCRAMVSTPTRWTSCPSPGGATIVTFTIDRLAHSPSPPIFAVVDFDAADGS